MRHERGYYFVRSRGERFDHFVEAALVPCGFVFVNNAFVNHAVNYGYNGAVCGYRGLLVTFLYCLDDVFDVGAHFGAKPHFMKSRFLRLAGPLPG